MNDNEINGNLIYVSFVVNFEEGAEISFVNGDNINNAPYDGHDYIAGKDLCLQSHFDYAINVGVNRVLSLFRHYGMKFTMSCCGMSAKKHPEIIRSAFSEMHEISAHGWRWESHFNKSSDEEKQLISMTKDAIYEIIGEYPRGWHTRSSCSENTRNLLFDANFLYDSDDYSSEMPFLINEFCRPYVVIPYSFDTNDMQFIGTGKFLHGNDFFEYIKTAIEWLIYENKAIMDRAVTVVSVGLHPRIIGRPARAHGLAKLLSWLKEHNNIIVIRRVDIANMIIENDSAITRKES